MKDRRIDRQRDRQIERQTDRDTHLHADKPDLDKISRHACNA